MAIELYWARGCAYSWRVQLGLDYKCLAWQSRPVDLATQEQQSPQLRRLTPRGRVPVLTDGGYVVFESVAILYDLDRNYPAPPLFGASAEEGGVIVRVIEEFQSYIEPHRAAVVGALGATRPQRPHAAVLEELLTVAGEELARGFCPLRYSTRRSRAGSRVESLPGTSRTRAAHLVDGAS
jgi:glutathione S-transferase